MEEQDVIFWIAPRSGTHRMGDELIVSYFYKTRKDGGVQTLQDFIGKLQYLPLSLAVPVLLVGEEGECRGGHSQLHRSITLPRAKLINNIM